MKKQTDIKKYKSNLFRLQHKQIVKLEGILSQLIYGIFMIIARSLLYLIRKITKCDENQKPLTKRQSYDLKPQNFTRMGNFVFLIAWHEIKFDELISLPSLQSCTLSQNNNFSLYNIQITITIEATNLS